MRSLSMVASLRFQLAKMERDAGQHVGPACSEALAGYLPVGRPTGRHRTPGHDGPAHQPDGLARPPAAGNTPAGAARWAGCAPRIASQAALSPYLMKHLRCGGGEARWRG